MKVLSSYMVLLTIAFCAVLVYRRTSRDLPFALAALTAVVCFFWGFAAAPWIVQLTIVGFLMRFDKFYLPKERQLS
jgi:hypothetical protein